jgi:hypothetical protein
VATDSVARSNGPRSGRFALSTGVGRSDDVDVGPTCRLGIAGDAQGRSGQPGGGDLAGPVMAAPQLLDPALVDVVADRLEMLGEGDR